MARPKAQTPPDDRAAEMIAALRELVDLQAEQLDEKDRKIAALERAAANRARMRSHNGDRDTA